jgi:glyoxylase-like metal-dependent hydrolase (beta-lactamase superfamily II)
MRIQSIDAGNFKLDGGAMFGVVPKSIWSKSIPADENNMCNFKMRCLLVEEGNRLVLIDTGMGDKQPEKWQGYYYRNGDGELRKSIKNAGYALEDVTDVVLTHLHFDHCGGAVYRSGDKLLPVFSNARYWTHSGHFASAMQPNPREKATFLSENISPLQESGQLSFLDQEVQPFSERWDFHYLDGHTEKMILPIVSYQDKKILFSADLIPTFAHIHVPYVMSYDVAPLVAMREKEHFLEKIVKENILVMFDHDVEHEMATILKTDKGYRAAEMGKMKDFISQ